MDAESKKLLQDTFALAQENNKMLRKVRKTQKWATFWQVVKWVLIIGLTVLSIYYVQPYVNKAVDTYNSVSSLQKDINSGNSKAIQDLIKKFTN